LLSPSFTSECSFNSLFFSLSCQADAQVEITAKVFHGYNAGEAYKGIDEEELKKTKGREYDYGDGK
jgi:hypothetical protein